MSYFSRYNMSKFLIFIFMFSFVLCEDIIDSPSSKDTDNDEASVSSDSDSSSDNPSNDDVLHDDKIINIDDEEAELLGVKINEQETFPVHEENSRAVDSIRKGSSSVVSEAAQTDGKSFAGDSSTKDKHSTTHSNEHDQDILRKRSEAEMLLKEAMHVMEEGDSRGTIRKLLFQLFYESSDRGNVKAREWVALGTLMGWSGYQSLPQAHGQFSELAKEGNPRGQFGLGMMYASGLFVNASIPHALIYLTFSALGGDELAQMALGYRHWTGIGLEENCESALTYYYRTAKKVANDVQNRSQSGGSTLLGPMVRRARLMDEVDSSEGLLSALGISVTVSEESSGSVSLKPLEGFLYNLA